ncbi:ATP-binding cassette domain-containing protein [Nocardia asteroides]|uniref:ATP-binding cassette domain-containing protein n=1 Tax=Nocardia asteroides TaxID=1824 RepID=UPI001E380427|nr:ATP-binding cassette domain-containing protein [Nocardia asteroides]UGT58622.1 ATP-binding cassette domain-containing protein [Nocardia asteroides]
MWQLLALSPWRVVVAVAWGVAALGSGLALAALAAWLIARAWQMPPVLYLSVAVTSVRALGISRGLCRYLERLASHDVALRAMTSARTTVYRTLAHSDIWWWRNNTSDHETGSRGGDLRELRRGDLLVRIGRDIDDLGAVVVRVLVPVAVAVVLSLAAVVLIAFISVPAAVILAVALAVSGILAPWLSSLAAREAEEANQADRAEFTAEALTVLDHAPELRVAGKLDAALAEADAATGRAVRAEDTAAAHSAWAAAATPLSIGVSALGALLVGIAAYGPTGGLPGGMTPMALTILVLVPLSAFEAVGALPAAATTLTTSRAALHRLRTAESAESGAHKIERIPLPEGRRIAVVGPSGAGKTTLLMAWAGLFDTPRDGVTFFAEDAHLFSTSILENLRVARGDLTTEEAEDALRAVGLGPWLDSLAEGVHTGLTGGAAAVSGGQRRRILLARALVAPARTLLLDEPTEHLASVEGARLLLDLLDADSGLVDPDRTVVVVTHQLPARHRADTVVSVDATGASHIVHPSR